MFIPAFEVKWQKLILRDFKVISNLCLSFGGSDLLLKGFTDSNMAGKIGQSPLGIYLLLMGPMTW